MLPRESACALRRPLWFYVAALVLYLSSGAFAFLFLSNDCDVYLYAEYADQIRSSSLRDLYRTRHVEYPPLAVAFMMGTRAQADRLPAAERVFMGLRAHWQPDDFRRFKLTFRAEMAVVYLLLFPAFLAVLGKCHPDESARGHAERLLTLGAAAGILGPMLYDKLDLALGFGVLVALLLLVGRRNVAAYVALAAAVSYKVVPVALAPVWVLATLPDDMLRGIRTGRLGRLAVAVAGRLALLAGLILALLIPFVLAGGGAFDFLAYHSQRGIEFESSYAALLAVFKTFGYRYDLGSAYGSAEVRSSLSPFLTGLAPVLVAAALLAAAAGLAFGLARSSREARPGAPATFGGTRAPLFAGFTLLVLLIVVVGNKVFSPQYLLWLLPVVPLAPLPLRPRRLFLGAFLGVCVLTRLMYPGLQLELLGAASPLDPGVHAGPTVLGSALLSVRCLLLIGMTGLLALHLFRRCGVGRLWRAAGPDRPNGTGLRAYANPIDPSAAASTWAWTPKAASAANIEFDRGLAAGRSGEIRGF